MRAALVATMCILSPPAFAEVIFEYENFQMTRTGAAELVLKFTNTGLETATFAKAECAFLDEKRKAITVNPVIAQNLSPGGTGYAKTFGPKDRRIKHAECRIVDVDYR